MNELDLAKTVVTAGLAKALSELFEFLKIKSSVFAAKKSLNIEEAYLKASKIEEVKTIWQVDRNVNLNEFYHPSKIRIDGKKVVINSLRDFPENGKILIRGTAGQGKSIFLRYVAGKELREGHLVPIFIELRKISERQELESLICNQLRDMDIKVDSSTLDFVYQSNKCVLLLDAFDEIAQDCVKDTINYLERLCQRYHDLGIIITSRHGAEIQHVTFFKAFELAPLEQSDFGPMLTKFFPDDQNGTYVNELLRAIHNSPSGIARLITTPLLLTLLTITYKTYHRIPEQLHEFYDNLFYLLINRHDSTKPGFRREFRSGLNENQMEKLFCAFCFYCSLEKKTAIPHSKAVEIVGKAKVMSNLNDVGEDNFLIDTKRNTCLIIEEGFIYHFIHKSIREYHAARFIKTSPLQLKEKFYKIALDDQRNFNGEISYLKQIDDYYCKKLFILPALDELFRRLQFDGKQANVSSEFLFSKFHLNIDAEGTLKGLSTSRLGSDYFNWRDEGIGRLISAIHSKGGHQVIIEKIKVTAPEAEPNQYSGMLFAGTIIEDTYRESLNQYLRTKSAERASICKELEIQDKAIENAF